MFLHIIKFEYLDAYRLRSQFNNQVTQEIDLAQELYGEMFEPLKEVNIFRQVFLNPETNTIE